MICRREVIMMARKNTKEKLPERGTVLPQVCEECREKYLKEGILLINPDNGRLIVLREEAFKHFFRDDETRAETIKRRIAWTEDAVLDMLFKKQEELKERTIEAKHTRRIKRR
jgi:hypothetical protein